MDTEIVIVDDDPIVANLTNDVLREVGFTTRVVKDCFQAEDVIRRERPRLVLLDIMMPGLDGITLLKRLKGDADLKAIRVIILSGKSFNQDKERALNNGADLFIEKPYNPDSLPEQVSGLIGEPAHPESAEEPKAASLSVGIWGCRGRPQGDPQPSTFGTRTPCVAVETPERLFVFDAGTGIVALGESSAVPADKEVWILLTHYHPAHIHGLGRFTPLGQPGRTVRIAGPVEAERGMKAVIQEAVTGPASAPLKARLQLFELKEDVYELAPGIKLSCLWAHHPGAALAFSLELDGKKIVYAPDSELYGDTATALQDYDEKLARFARDADLLFHDAHFGEDDYVAKAGHSSYENALLLASLANVKELVLFHLNPAYTDEKLEAMEKAAQARAETSALSFRCRLAREGLTLSL